MRHDQEVCTRIMTVAAILSLHVHVQCTCHVQRVRAMCIWRVRAAPARQACPAGCRVLSAQKLDTQLRLISRPVGSIQATDRRTERGTATRWRHGVFQYYWQ